MSVFVPATVTRPRRAPSTTRSTLPGDVDIDVTLQGPDLEEPGELLKLPLPGTPPYKLAGKVTHQEQEKRWNLVALRGTVGDSDIQGDVSLELSGERPTVVADLKSKTLDLDDLGVLVGAPPGTGPGETASREQKQKAAQEAAAKAPVLPDKQFDVPGLHAFDARISFSGDTVQAMKLPLEHMEAKVTLQDGHVKIDPARLDVAGGKLETRVGLNAPSGVLNGDLDLTLRNVKLDQLLAAFKVDVGAIEMEKEGVGTFGGHAKLTVKGNSIHDMAAAADGELAVIMGGGQINALIIEALGLDVGEMLAVVAAGDEEEESGMVPVQCFVSRFEVQDGVMTTRALVLETSDSTVTGSGTIDLGKETLDLQAARSPEGRERADRQHAGRHQGHISRSADRRGLGGTGGEGAGRPRAGRRVAGDRRNSPVHRDRRGGRRQLRGAHERGPNRRRCSARHSERQARQFERALSTLRFMVAPCLESLTTRSAGAGARRRAHAGAAYASKSIRRGRLLTFECRSSLGPLRRHRHKPALRRRPPAVAHAVGISWLSVTRFWDVEPDHPVRGSSLAFADAHGSRGDRHSQKSTPELVAAGHDGHAASPVSPAAMVAAIVVVVGALYVGRDILIPLALAILLSFMLAPIVIRLRRFGLGRIPSVLAVVLLLFVALLGLGAIVASQVVHLADNLPRYEWNLRSKIRDLRIAIPSGGVVERTSDMLRDLGQELEEATSAGRERGQERGRRPRLPSPCPCRSRSRRRRPCRRCASWADRWSRRSRRRAWWWSS